MKGASRGFSRVAAPVWGFSWGTTATVQKHQFFSAQLSLWSISHPYMTTGKTIALTIQTFVGKVMSLLFNTLFRFVLSFFPRNKSLNFMAAVTIHSDSGAQENKICHCCLFFPIYLPWSDGTRCWDLHFLNVEFLSQLSHSPLSLSSARCAARLFLWVWLDSGRTANAIWLWTWRPSLASFHWRG